MLRHNRKGMSKIGNIKQTDMYIMNTLKIIFILHTIETYNTDCTKDYWKLFMSEALYDTWFQLFYNITLYRKKYYVYIVLCNWTILKALIFKLLEHRIIFLHENIKQKNCNQIKQVHHTDIVGCDLVINERIWNETQTHAKVQRKLKMHKLKYYFKSTY